MNSAGQGEKIIISVTERKIRVRTSYLRKSFCKKLWKNFGKIITLSADSFLVFSINVFTKSCKIRKFESVF